jgi:hypothetical protein
MRALHKCDNPACVNPDHLFAGTQLDNVRDMWAKGRASPPPIHIGEKNPSAKLTAATVALMRRDFLAGMSLSRACAKYGVKSVTHASQIRSRKVWKHVAPAP